MTGKLAATEYAPARASETAGPAPAPPFLGSPAATPTGPGAAGVPGLVRQYVTGTRSTVSNGAKFGSSLEVQGPAHTTTLV